MINYGNVTRENKKNNITQIEINDLKFETNKHIYDFHDF